MGVEVDASANSQHEKLIGEVLANRYQIEELIGEGAMGAVYRAKHVKVGRAFAVKVLHSRLLEDNKVQQRFEREAELAGRLRHPNVIGVVDVGETPGGLRYMVMDFAEGPDLASLLSEAPMPAQRIIHLTRQLLEGLYHAHEAGLIHRDFKPENVIIERDTHDAEVPRIVDFGIAILREGGESSAGPGRLTTNGLVLGTPHYMAPEQAVADPIDHRIDLFALGIIVYEMLCGKLPFDGSGAEVARANLLLDPPPISERVPYLEVDPLLEAFARRLMAKKRDLRPATAKIARELLDLIERDREAVAAALNVPLATANRAPMTTQPSAPVRHQGNHEGTFPPPIRSEAATPVANPAKRMATPAGARAIATETTEPISKKRNTPVIAAVIGIGLLGGAGAVVMLTKNGHAPDKVAMMTPGSAAEPVTPRPVEVKQPEQPVEKQPEQVTEKAPDPPTTPDKTPEPTTPPTTGKAAAKAGTKKQPTKKTMTQTQKVETPAVATQPTPPKSVDANTLATQYQSVGSQLKALEQMKGADATSDLWPRYRLIRIVDAMSTQEKRDQTAAVLAKLTNEITTRKK